jgi:hypothetical protein
VGAGHAERAYPEGHKEARYQFTTSDAADNGVDIFLMAIQPGFSFRLTGVYYWFRARTVGVLTGMLYALGTSLGASIWTAELEVAGGEYNSDEIHGAPYFGRDGEGLLFRWTSQGGFPLPALRGGIIVWGYQVRSV